MLQNNVKISEKVVKLRKSHQLRMTITSWKQNLITEKSMKNDALRFSVGD
jgi:hypothetical protein